MQRPRPWDQEASPQVAFPPMPPSRSVHREEAKGLEKGHDPSLHDPLTPSHICCCRWREGHCGGRDPQTAGVRRR